MSGDPDNLVGFPSTIMEPMGQTGLIPQAGQRKLKVLIQLYARYLQEHPILTKSATAGVLAGLGDIISQWLVQVGQPGRRRVQWRSVVAVSFFGLVVTGPLTHHLYHFLEAISPSGSSVSALRKVVLDRLIFTPPYLLAFFYTVALLEGKSPTEAWTKVRSIFWSAVLWNWAVWGCAQYINMNYVPLKYRVLFANLVAFVWNIYTAFLRRK